ncbi:hypothetical protein BpHYR1_046298 [Brachionus plicatilis]|uniref:Uncharacterized protein n=1 Tax=Brachionus plicatilis TaxID=10195 RepID=A0A3M7P1A6_BRAPC|nr:hypothetical protein BpHYR1_046298 [Brachionus plicatilis]
MNNSTENHVYASNKRNITENSYLINKVQESHLLKILLVSIYALRSRITIAYQLLKCSKTCQYFK